MSIWKISIAFCIVSATIFYIRWKKIFNPVTMMCSLWAVIIYLSRLQLYSLFRAEGHTYAMILMGLIAFVIGCILVPRFKVHKKDKNQAIELPYNYKFIYVLYAICIFYLAIRVSAYGTEILSMGLNLSALNELKSGQDIESSGGLLNALGFLVATPLYFPLTIVFSLDFWRGERDMTLLVLEIIMTVERIILYGGRYPLIQLVISMVISMTYTDVGKGITFRKIKNRIWQIVVASIGIIAFFMLTWSKTKAPFMTLYLDFAMQPYMFQYWGKKLNDYSYGIASMCGFVHPILYILKNVGILSDLPRGFNTIYDNIQKTFSAWVSIGTKLSANAYTSSFWYLYYDGREIGICIGMFVWGIISFIFFRKACKQNTNKSIGNYIMMAFTIIYTFTDMEYYKYYIALGFIYWNIIINKRYVIKLGGQSKIKIGGIRKTEGFREVGKIQNDVD